MTDIEKTLAERGARYGDFTVHAEIAQSMKKVMAGSRNWDKLASYQREGLEMICHKIARMLNGDPTYIDSVDDIIGYAKLIANGMRTEGWPYQNWARDVEGVEKASIPTPLAPQPDADGWIPWGGGYMPVKAEALVTVKLRDGMSSKAGDGPKKAGDWLWAQTGMNSDIIAYKVVDHE